MNLVRVRKMIAILLVYPGSAAADEPTSIPLEDIWAYQMPGTRDVRELEPDKFGEAVRGKPSDELLKIFEKSDTSQILKALIPSKPNQEGCQAFAVLGTGKEALKAARSVLADGQKPRRSFPPNSHISIIFFSNQFGYYVHLSHVRRQGNAIEIAFSFVPHRTKELTSHFALIPLGELMSGEYAVDVVKLPMNQSFVAAGFKSPELESESSVVSGSFHFKVDSR